MKDFSVDTAKAKAEAKTLISWLYGEYLSGAKSSSPQLGGGFGGFGGGIRSNIKCNKDEFIGFIKSILPAESKRENAIGDLFWVFGTQDKAFTEVDRKLDRDHFLQDRAASTGVFNAT